MGIRASILILLDVFKQFYKVLIQNPSDYCPSFLDTTSAVGRRMNQGTAQQLGFLKPVAKTLFQPNKFSHPSTDARCVVILMRLLRPASGFAFPRTPPRSDGMARPPRARSRSDAPASNHKASSIDWPKRHWSL